MNIFILYLGIIMQQGQLIDFPQLLGEKASIVEQLLLNNGFQKNIHNPQAYELKENFKILFGLTCSGISFSADDNEEVNSLILTLKNIVNKETFDMLNQEFGKPVSIKVIDQEFYYPNDGTIDTNDNHIFRRGYATFNEGSFEDNPLFIIWRQEDYEVILQMIYPEGFNLGGSMLIYRNTN